MTYRKTLLKLYQSLMGLMHDCTSLAQNSPPSVINTKLFSSSGTLQVHNILFIFAALGFCSSESEAWW